MDILDAASADADDGPPFTRAPRLISPRNGATTGTVRAALSRRPLLRWRAVAEATSYEVQVDDSCDRAAFRSCSFPSPEAAQMSSAPSLRLSSGLAVSTSAPAGRRYYWRVRGCGAAQCTPWSDVRYLDVGYNPSDFTGEGDTDLAIGNANVSVNGTAAVGAVYLLPGVTGGIPGFLPPLQPPDPAFGDHYGIAAASAGDVDGDGYPDMAISAEIIDQSGRVYLYRGGNPPQPGPSQILANPEGQTVAFFGHALVGADFNGDGHSDLAVGAEIQDGVAFSDGKVFVYAGESSPTGLPAAATWTLENPARQEQGYFGSALAVGDFDGDGYADLAVAARQQDAIGRVFVYRGGPDGVAAPPVATLDDPVIVTNAGFGSALAAGDFDGDGYTDLAVAAAYENKGAMAAVGHVYVFHGGPMGIADRTAPWLTLDNPAAQMNSTFGVALVAADFDDDDIDDLAVSAPGQDSNAGSVHIYQGAAAGLAAQPYRTVNGTANDLFGYVMAAGDRSPADGFADLIIGAPGGTGKLVVFDGSATGVRLPAGVVIAGPMPDGNVLGLTSLSSASP